MGKIDEIKILIQTQASYCGHSLIGLETGTIPFATIKQIRFIAGLIRKCNCPEEYRLYIVGQLIGREIRSTKDLSLAEASALLDWILVGSDGKGDSETEPCEEAREAIGLLLLQTMAAGVAKMQNRQNGGNRVITQLGFA